MSADERARFHVARAMHHLRLGDHERAARHVRRAQHFGSPLGSVLGHVGSVVQGQAAEYNRKQRSKAAKLAPVVIAPVLDDAEVARLAKEAKEADLSAAAAAAAAEAGKEEQERRDKEAARAEQAAREAEAAAAAAATEAERAGLEEQAKRAQEDLEKAKTEATDAADAHKRLLAEAQKKRAEADAADAAAAAAAATAAEASADATAVVEASEEAKKIVSSIGHTLSDVARPNVTLSAADIVQKSMLDLKRRFDALLSTNRRAFATLAAELARHNEAAQRIEEAPHGTPDKKKINDAIDKIRQTVGAMAAAAAESAASFGQPHRRAWRARVEPGSPHPRAH
jgi:chromosome segregation ATPase